MATMGLSCTISEINTSEDMIIRRYRNSIIIVVVVFAAAAVTTTAIILLLLLLFIENANFSYLLKKSAFNGPVKGVSVGTL